MNNALWIYGDSFFETETFYADQANKNHWIVSLADKLDVQLRNRSRLGSSSEYAFINFFKDASSIKAGDFVIFNISTKFRMHTVHQLTHPSTAMSYMCCTKDEKNIDVRDPLHIYYLKNKKFLDWYYKNCDWDLTTLHYELYVLFLKMFAEANPDVTVLVTFTSRMTIKMPFEIQMPKNLLISNKTFIDISFDEIGDTTDDDKYWRWVEHTRFDARLNHLSCSNLKILTDTVYQAFTRLDAAVLNSAKFEVSVFDKKIDSVEEYLKLCDAGKIYYNELICKTLQDNIKINFFDRILYKIKRWYRFRNLIKNHTDENPFIY